IKIVDHYQEEHLQSFGVQKFQQLIKILVKRNKIGPDKLILPVSVAVAANENPMLIGADLDFDQFTSFVQFTQLMSFTFIKRLSMRMGSVNTKPLSSIDFVKSIIWTGCAVDIADAILTAIVAKTITIFEGSPGRRKTMIAYKLFLENFTSLLKKPAKLNEKVKSMEEAL
ncbi:MAG: hypothetical protein EZS28_034328, partial [Streblomastix strix]